MQNQNQDQATKFAEIRKQTVENTEALRQAQKESALRELELRQAHDRRHDFEGLVGEIIGGVNKEIDAATSLLAGKQTPASIKAAVGLLRAAADELDAFNTGK